MELFIMTIFWIATLHSFLHAHPTPAASNSCGDLQIQEMRDDVKCPPGPGTVFYTPENVMDKCFTTALECMKRELNGTVQLECEDEGEYIGQAASALERMISERQTRNQVNTTECPKCEQWKEKPFGNFLEKMEELCHRLNSART